MVGLCLKDTGVLGWAVLLHLSAALAVSAQGSLCSWAGMPEEPWSQGIYARCNRRKHHKSCFFYHHLVTRLSFFRTKWFSFKTWPSVFVFECVYVHPCVCTSACVCWKRAGRLQGDRCSTLTLPYSAKQSLTEASKPQPCPSSVLLPPAECWGHRLTGYTCFLHGCWEFELRSSYVHQEC